MLDSIFAPDVDSYSASVPHGVSSTTVTATPTQSAAQRRHRPGRRRPRFPTRGPGSFSVGETGESSKTVNVTVLDDAHDEGEERRGERAQGSYADETAAPHPAGERWVPASGSGVRHSRGQARGLRRPSRVITPSTRPRRSAVLRALEVATADRTSGAQRQPAPHRRARARRAAGARRRRRAGVSRLTEASTSRRAV